MDIFDFIKATRLSDDAIPSSLRRAADTAVNELLTVAKNLRAAKLNVDDEDGDIAGEQPPAH